MRVGELCSQRIGRLVYLDRLVPSAAVRQPLYGALPEGATTLGKGLYLGDPTATGAVRINPRASDPKYREEFRRGLLRRHDDRIISSFRLRLTPDLPLSLWTTEQPTTVAGWGSLPRTFIRCTQDRAIPIALQDLMIHEADQFTPDNKFDVRSMETSHSPFASQPQRLAEIFNDLAQSNDEEH